MECVWIRHFCIRKDGRHGARRWHRVIGCFKSIEVAQVFIDKKPVLNRSSVILPEGTVPDMRRSEEPS